MCNPSHSFHSQTKVSSKIWCWLEEDKHGVPDHLRPMCREEPEQPDGRSQLLYSVLWNPEGNSHCYLFSEVLGHSDLLVFPCKLQHQSITSKIFFIEVPFWGINVKTNLGESNIFRLLGLPVFWHKKFVYFSIFFVFFCVLFCFVLNTNLWTTTMNNVI